jgi:DNA-binding transcriptional LysR family regulator
MPQPRLAQIETLADVVELGSFTAAARRRGLTQPAVSQQIKALERRLGVRLVERIGRRAHATAAAETLLLRFRPIHAAVAEALDAVSRHRAQAAGRLRLGTGDTACIYLLPPLLRRLKVKHPLLEIVVRTGNSPEMLQALEANELDLALITLPAPSRPFAVTPVLQDEMVAIFPASEPAVPRRATAEAMARRPLILYEPGGNARRVIEDWFTAARLASKPAMELGSIEAIKRLAASGLGAAILPRLAVARPIDRPGLLVRPLAPPLYRTLGVVLRRDKPLGRGLRALVDLLVEAGRRARRSG